VIRNKNASFRGPAAEFKLDAKVGWVEEPTYEFRENSSFGKAARAEFLDRNRTRLTKPTYSTCNPENLDWYFSSSSMLIDKQEDDATGENGVLHFFDTPYILFTLLLFPHGE
jgi:LPS-assembly protein